MSVVLLKQEGTNPDAAQVTFEEFWRAYPRRVAKKDALKAWQQIRPNLHAKIMSAIAEQRKSEQWRKDGGQFVPYPASWLRGERWDDEIATDLSMGECVWNRNGNREPGKPKCSSPGSVEKNGMVFCRHHGTLV
jgi:hypothetical protein